jgi:beta-glucanase (GH16 family)
MFVSQILASGQTPPSQAAGYTLVFSDNFATDTSINMNNASNPNGGGYTWYNPGMWWQSPAPWSHYSTNGTDLNLNWTPGQSPPNTSLSSCSPNGTSHCQTWNHGYFEASMRWDVTTGAWPAFWMIPVEGHTLPGSAETGELDIMEGQGQNLYYATVHDWRGPGGTTFCQAKYVAPGGVNLTDYHTYGMLWTSGTIQFYFDNAAVGPACRLDATIDAQNYFLILASQEGVNWNYGNTSGVTANTISADYAWVHVWQLNSSPPPPNPAAPTGLTATVN